MEDGIKILENVIFLGKQYATWKSNIDEFLEHVESLLKWIENNEPETVPIEDALVAISVKEISDLNKVPNTAIGLALVRIAMSKTALEGPWRFVLENSSRLAKFLRKHKDAAFKSAVV